MDWKNNDDPPEDSEGPGPLDSTDASTRLLWEAFGSNITTIREARLPDIGKRVIMSSDGTISAVSVLMYESGKSKTPFLTITLHQNGDLHWLTNGQNLTFHLDGTVSDFAGHVIGKPCMTNYHMVHGDFHGLNSLFANSAPKYGASNFAKLAVGDVVRDLASLPDFTFGS